MKILFTALTILLVTDLNASVYELSYGEPVQAPRKILIVEDDMITGNLLKLMTANYFYEMFGKLPGIEVEKTDKEAMESFDISNPGLVLLDYSFYGYQKELDVLHHIRKDKKHPVKVVAFSKSMRRSLRHFKHGVNDIELMKKFYSLMNKAYFPNDKQKSL